MSCVRASASTKELARRREQIIDGTVCGPVVDSIASRRLDTTPHDAELQVLGRCDASMPVSARSVETPTSSLARSLENPNAGGVTEALKSSALIS